MSKELVIASNRHETKVAILEDDQLVEIYFQRANEYSLAGSIHKGRVTRVLPGMQSAFVDVGLERDAFLYVSDFFEENEEYDLGADDKPVRRESGRPGRDPRGGDGDADPEPSPASISSQPVVAAPPPERVMPPPPPAAAVEHPPAGEAQRDRRPDDERGRRSRRRRNRGRGFPDSKYASETAEEAPAATVVDSAVSPVRDAAPFARTTDALPGGAFPIVLPGESLAKYSSRPAPPPEPEVEATSNEPVASALASGEPEWDDRPGGETPQPLEAGSEPIPPVSSSPTEPSEPVGHGALFERELNTKIELVGESHGAHDVIEEPIASVMDALALAEPAEPESGLDLQEAPPLEIAANGIEQGEADELGLDDPEADTETASELDSESAPDADTASVEGAGPLSASVREQQPARFMQRSSRRTRRRTRGNRGDRGPDRNGETAAPATTDVPRVETARTEAPRSEYRERPEPRERTVAAPRVERSAAPSISELLREGQEIIVQIAKEPIGQKGARITSHIALPGRYVVYMPTVEHMGVSRKIDSDEERQRLKRILQVHRTGVPGGYIVRTAGEGKTEEEIAADMAFLHNLWLDMRQKAEKRPAPLLLHHDLEIVQRILRDQITENFKAVWVDNEELYESVLRFMQRFQPALIGRVKLYTRPAPIFDAFNITPELEKALRPKVWLKSGGYIVINQTEALVAIDVNTGKYVGKSNRLEDTIVKTNLEAVKEIVRQIRLRDLGGIIVVDFIDMDERKNRQKVMQTLEEAMRVDRAPYKILQFNDFGLVAITRKRVKQSLERTLCSPCPQCEGAGYVKSVQTVIGEILHEAVKIARAVDGKESVLRVHPEVAKLLKSNQNQYLEELEEILGLPVMVVSDATLHHERFDLA